MARPDKSLIEGVVPIACKRHGDPTECSRDVCPMERLQCGCAEGRAYSDLQSAALQPSRFMKNHRKAQGIRHMAGHLEHPRILV